jgi:hypothetical protein
MAISGFSNPLSERAYNQADITVTVNGIPIQGLMEGTSVTVIPHGGEVEVTQGTDGPGLNVATKQGGEIRMTLRESSPGHAILQQLRTQQELAPVGVPVVIFTGVGAVETLLGSLVSLPGELTTGDKKQAARIYRFVGTTLNSMPSQPVLGLALAI